MTEIFAKQSKSGFVVKEPLLPPPVAGEDEVQSSVVFRGWIRVFIWSSECFRFFLFVTFGGECDQLRL